VTPFISIGNTLCDAHTDRQTDVDKALWADMLAMTDSYVNKMWFLHDRRSASVTAKTA